MPATKTQLAGGAFQDSEGNLLVNGYLKFHLSQDASVSGVGNICSGVEITIQLDASGNVATSPVAQYIWANDVLSPINTFYRVTGFTAAGQPAWGPNNQQISSGGTGGGAFDLGTWVPNQVISWTPPPNGITFQTNGTNNSSQTLLNLEAGSGITLTDEGDGGIEISASGGGGTLQTATLTLSSSQLLNLATSGPLIVAAGIAGMILVPVTAVFNYIYGGIAYGRAGTTSLELGYQGYPFNFGNATNVLTLGFVDQTQNMAHISTFVDGPIDDASSNFVGKGIDFGLNPGAANLTLGNGTMVVTVSYVAVPAS